MTGEKRLLASTPQGSLRLLGSGGTLAVRSYAQIRQYLKASLGAAEAELLAEPSFDNANGRIDWLGELEGEAKPLTALDPETQEKVRRELAQRRQRIAGLAEALSRREQQSAILLGELLRHALSVPNEDSVLVAGERIVLVNWGAAADEPLPQQHGKELAAPSRRAAAAPPVPPAAVTAAVAATPAAERSRSTLWALPLWLLFAALMAGIYYLFLEACAVSGPGAQDNDNPFLTFCPGTAVAATEPPPELAAEQARAGLLRERLRQLEIRIAEERRECSAAGLVPQPTPEEEALLPEDEEPLVEEEQAVEEEPVVEEEPLVEEEPVVEEDPVAETTDPEEFQRRVDEQGGQEGLVQVTLIWDGPTDLDLYVFCPGGGSINYTSTTGCGGGTLDIDANVQDIMANPVEHITWPNGAPPGEYRVLVKSANGTGTDRFNVQITTPSGQREVAGQVNAAQGLVEVTRFTLP